MSPDLLCDIGAFLFGERWRAPLAREWGVSTRTVDYYADGTQRIPAERIPRLRELVEAKQGAAPDLLRRMAGTR